MTGAIRINHLNKEISISKSFARSAMNANNFEYRDLQEVMKRHPDYRVTQRAIKKNLSKETYAGLTYEYMRNYIVSHTNPEDDNSIVNEFDEKVLISKCHAKGLRYPTIKKWFLEKFPEVAEFGVIKEEVECNAVPEEDNNLKLSA